MFKHLVTQGFTLLWVWCIWKTTSTLNLWQSDSKEMKTWVRWGWTILRICRKFVLKYISFFRDTQACVCFSWVHFQRLCLTYWANSVIQDASVLIHFAELLRNYLTEHDWTRKLNQTGRFHFRRQPGFSSKTSSQDGLAFSSKESQECLTNSTLMDLLLFSVGLTEPERKE